VKFNSGYWRTRDGFRVQHPVAAYDVVHGEDSFTVHAPTKRVENRGATIANPVLTIRAWAPMADVVAVSVTSHSGRRSRGPSPVLNLDAEHRPEIAVTDKTARLTSGMLSFEVDLGESWNTAFVADGLVLTSSGAKCIGRVQTDDGKHYMHERLSLGVGEYVYGLGERFTPFVKNGQVVDIWNDDGGTSSELAYKNVPFYLTNRGYGVFVNSFGQVSFEVGSEVVSRVQFSQPGQTLEYMVIYGPTPKEVLSKYTALTGRPAVPPAWSFGLWLSTSFLPSWDETTVSGFVSEMAARDVPLSVFHFDSFWMREFHLCDFSWDRRAFPDPAATLEKLTAAGVRSCVWINPFIAQQSELFAEAMQAGYLLRRPNGDVWQTDVWQAGMAIVDFTNPAARQWWSDKLAALLKMGVDCFKTDFGECIPTDVEYFDGSDPELMHNYYSYLYNETVFDVVHAHQGEGQAVLFARSATIGGQKFPVHWGGDPEPTYVSMAESLRGGLSLGASGFGFWSHDIGGFEGTPTPALFMRWTAFGLLSSHSRLHGSISYRVPWLFGEEANDVLRRFTKLKLRLMPYLFSAATEAHNEGVPLMRAMMLEFPEDPSCAQLDRQYMFGPDLLVAPVFCDEGDVSYYVPAGAWTSYLTGDRVVGPGWVSERHDFTSIPLLVRPGAVIACGAREDRPDYDYLNGLTLECFTVQQGARTVAVASASPGGETALFTVERSGNTVRVAATGAAATWRVRLVGVHSVNSVYAGRSESDERGIVVVPNDPSTPIQITLTGS
jgi:alpha-D-xyloside xylohydrolase